MTVPAENELTTVRRARSTSAIALFSWSVAAAMSRPSTPPTSISSSRWFSMAMAAKTPLGPMSIESGWPPRSMVRTIARRGRSMTARWPEGRVRSVVVSTATRAYRALGVIVTEVG